MAASQAKFAFKAIPAAVSGVTKADLNTACDNLLKASFEVSPQFSETVLDWLQILEGGFRSLTDPTTAGYDTTYAPPSLQHVTY